MAHTVAFAEGTFNPVAQMGNKECFDLFTADELDAIQWDSPAEEMARSVEYDIVPDDDKLLDVIQQPKKKPLQGDLPPAPFAPSLFTGEGLSLQSTLMSERPPILQLRALTKSFGRFNAVSGIDLDIADGEFFTIVGPSGSGKTTMIRMLAGMELPTSGDILLRGKRINDVPANKRPTCMVFQSLALFPHRTVGENRIPA